MKISLNKLSIPSGTSLFLWPSVVLLMFFAIFPLVVSLWLSFSRITLLGGFEISFAGLDNYAKLFTGSQSDRLFGVFETPSIIGWVGLGIVVALLSYWLVRYSLSTERTIFGLFIRVVLASLATLLAWLVASTLTGEGRAGSLVVTLLFVYVGVVVQYLLGLGLALLASNISVGRRMFRVIFLIPMMMTPIGIAYTFRMITDSTVGPLAPVFQALGFEEFALTVTTWGARSAIVISDTWQWTPFMFIVLLSAIVSQPTEPLEAAKIDGAGRFKTFWHITLPAILPVSTALLMIRMIEAYKLIDLPRILTGGGPGLASDTLTLFAYDLWRTVDIGTSASVAYILLILVTVTTLAFVHFARRKVTDQT